MYFVDFIRLASFLRIISCLLSVFCLVGLCKRRMSSGNLSLLFCGACILNSSYFIFGKLSPNLDQKNLDFTYTQDILWEKKGPKFTGFQDYFFSNLSLKEGSLFCFVVMRSTKPGCFDRVLGVFGKLLTRRGAWAWSMTVFGKLLTRRGAWAWSMTLGLAVQKFLNIERFLH